MKKFILLGFVLMLSFGQTFAQKADPKADKLIEKFIDAIGGNKKLESVKEIYKKMTMTAPTGQQIQMEALVSKKGRGYVKMNMMGMDFVVYAYKDGKGFTLTRQMTYEDMDQEKLKQISSKNESFYNGLDNYKQYDRKYLGKQELDGKTYEAVEMTIDDQKVVFYIDPKTHLVAAEKAHNPQTDSDVVTFFKDYKTFDGIKFPTTIVAKLDNSTSQTVTVTDIKLNPTDIDESVFQKPE